MNLARNPAAQFALFLAVALILRCDTFGDPNLHGDEAFYYTVGIAMHHGAIPYVDVWDRKPFGLFALYYLIAAISTAPLCYELVATLFAAGTAWAICAISCRWAKPSGGLVAGVAYLLWLAPLQGFGGQSPVFYNLFIALAALLLVGALDRLRQGKAPASAAIAMLLAGLGITIKTTALFEAAFLGLYGVAAFRASGAGAGRVGKLAALWAMIGAAPSLVIAAGYRALGQWPAFWQAMVISNLAKKPLWATSLLRLEILLVFLIPFLLLGAAGLVKARGEARRFQLLWLLASALGLAAVPNFYIHYAMPLLVPLCVAASAALEAPLPGTIAIATLAYLSFTLAAPFQFEHTRQSRAAMADLVQTVRSHIGSGPLMTYDGPSQLYVLTGQPFITPLVFPTHLSHLIEKDVSQFSTLGETQKALARHPGAVVMAVPIRNGPVNEETHQLVLAYVHHHCRLIKFVATPERLRTDQIGVWGDCIR